MNAEAPAPITARGSPWNRRSILAIAIVGMNLMACCCGGPMPKGNAGSSLPGTPDEFVSRYGKPDAEVSTENDRPRPLVLSRQFVYKKKNVRVFFVPEEGHNGNSVPVRGWQILQAQDNSTNKVISDAEADRRLR